ncbi:MAG: glycosyltransferase family 2 protein [Bacteroidia bacterium]
MLKIAIIIPCYNESASIAKVLEEIYQLKPADEYQLVPIAVNDCSTDHTLEILQRSGVIYLDLPVNLGIGGTVHTGFKYALGHNFDIAIQLDGDGQHPVHEIPDLIAPILAGNSDVTIGSRFIRNKGYQSTYLRRSGIAYFKGLNKILTGLIISDTTSGFRALNKQALSVACDYYPDEYPEPEALILYAMNRLRITEVPVEMRERQGGSSSIHSYKSIYYMAKVSLAVIFLYLRLKFYGKRDPL